ncbi:MAG: oligosaccharide flippase family protein [Flavobacteriaceae bacterium]|jgi:O-antigen/teichoic acid export membrane protein|nr:oligosaccharide flippase family protein [Flavobacteriaceae bacterium]
MSHTQSLLKNTLIYTVGNLGSRVLTFVLLPIYSFYLNREEVGYYDLILTSLMLLTPLLTLQISESVYRWLLDTKEGENQSKIISNGVLVLGFGIVLSTLLFILFRNQTKLEYLNYIFLIFILYCVFPFLQQTVRGLGKNKLYAGSSILNSVLLFAFSVLFIIVLKMKLEGLLISMLIANLVSVLFIVFKINLFKFLSFKKFDRKFIRELLLYSWPLIPNTISWWLINEVNRFIILGNLGLEDNGIFAVAIRFPSIILIINSIFMLAWQDQAIQIQDSKEKEKFYQKIFDAFMRFQICTALLLIPVSRFVVQNFFGSDFSESWKYMPILYLGVVYSSFAAFLGANYLGAKKTREIFTTTIYGSILNVAVCYLFINQIGLYAPTIGTLLGFILIWILRLRKSGVGKSLNWKTFLLLNTISFLYFFLTHLEMFLIDLLMGLTSIILFWIFNQNLIKFLISATTKYIPIRYLK